MSTFTAFHKKKSLIYSDEISRLLGEPYWFVDIPFRYYLGTVGSGQYVDIERGFLTDGTTIPNWLTWLIPKHGKHSQAVVLHDKLCVTYYVLEDVLTDNGAITVRVPVTRREIDHIFYEGLKVLKVSKWRRGVIRLGVDGYRLVTNPTKPVEDRLRDCVYNWLIRSFGA